MIWRWTGRTPLRPGLNIGAGDGPGTHRGEFVVWWPWGIAWRLYVRIRLGHPEAENRLIMDLAYRTRLRPASFDCPLYREVIFFTCRLWSPPDRRRTDAALACRLWGAPQ